MSRGAVCFMRQADELSYAAEHLATIEINATYYGSQKPASFAKWRDAAPANFRYSVKASRYSTNRKVLAEGEQSVAKFLNQGIVELGDKLGPILWQFANTKKFEPDDFAAFLSMLPEKLEGLPLRHALEVRHESFCCAEFVELAGKHGVAIVYADHEEYPAIADLTADFVYTRLQRSKDNIATGYSKKALDKWARIARSWAQGHAPEGLQYVGASQPRAQARDVYLYFISGAKHRNPAAAMAIAERL